MLVQGSFKRKTFYTIAEACSHCTSGTLVINRSKLTYLNVTTVSVSQLFLPLDLRLFCLTNICV